MCIIISVFELNAFSTRLATYPSDSHVGVGKYYSHYAAEGGEAGIVWYLQEPKKKNPSS